MSDGFLLVDKPQTWTSHDVVAKLRRLFDTKKVGHAGTLDPMATGLLVVGMGRATRLLRFVQDLTKEYVTTVRFGIATDSGDADGVMIQEAPVDFDVDQLQAALPHFVGTIAQTPPAVSAIKLDGTRAHELARAGVAVELEPRPVEVYEIELVAATLPSATLRIRCGKGTYIRVLGDDIAKHLGTRAHLTALRRTANGSLTVDEAVTIEDVEASDDRDRLLMSSAAGLADLPSVQVPSDQKARARHGVPITDVAAPSGPVRVLDGDALIGVYRQEGDRLVSEVVVA